MLGEWGKNTEKRKKHREMTKTKWKSWWGRASLVAQMVKWLPAMQETWVRSLGREDPLKKEMATHSSILAWKILWSEEPGSLQSMGLQRVGHDWATKHKLRSLAHLYAWGDARVRAHGGHSFTIHLSYLGASICVSYILSSFSLMVGSDCSSDGC